MVAGTGKTLMARKIGEMLHAREPKVVNGPGMCVCVRVCVRIVCVCMHALKKEVWFVFFCVFDLVWNVLGCFLLMLLLFLEILNKYVGESEAKVR